MNIPEEEALKEIRSLADSGQKIAAIKRIREQFSVSLADATQLLDWILKNDPSNPRPMAAFRKEIRNRPLGLHRSLKLPIMIFLGVGLILLAITGFLISHELSFRKTAAQVEGVVVENIRRGRTYSPVFEFEWQGQTKRAQSNLSSSRNGGPTHKVGEKVPIRVDPNQLDAAHVDTWFGTWFAPTLVAGIGVIFTCIGGGILLIGRRRS